MVVTKRKVDETIKDDETKSDITQEKKPRLEGQALLELRQRLRQRKKMFKLMPDFRLKPIGLDARLELASDLRKRLTMKDLQNLLLYSILGTRAPVEPSRWCKFDQLNKLTNVNLVVIDGVGIDDFTKVSKKYPSMRSLFPFQLEFTSPLTYNSTIPDELCILAISSRRKKEFKQTFGKVNKACQLGLAFKVQENTEKKEVEGNKGDKRSEEMLLKLLLSLSQMIEENYPLPLEGPMQKKYIEFVTSKDEYSEVTEKSPLYAVDCEMCLTSVGKLELTKVCVVDRDLNEVYHSFVKPRNPIVDYLTRYSGITPALLQDVETRLEDVQEALKRYLKPP